MAEEGNDHLTIVTLDTPDDPRGFIVGFMEQLFGQKFVHHAWGRTVVGLNWKDGVLESAEITDTQTIKFVSGPKTIEEARAKMDALRREYTGKSSRSEV